MSDIFIGKAVGQEVRRLFDGAPPGARRVVITAYVGRDPVRLLGDVSGMEIYCSPSPTGTYASGVLALQGKGAKVYFSKLLHMKVYWVEGHGALIGSANLSDNGLDDGLAEVLVAVPAETVSIANLIQSFKRPPKRATRRSIEELQRGNDRAARRGRPVGENAADGPKTRGGATKFPHWYARKAIPPIKLGWYNTRADPHPTLEAAARAAGFTDGVADFNGVASETTYRPEDWVLVFKVRKDVAEPSTRDAYWLRVDAVKKLTNKEAKDSGIEDHPWVAWQGDELNQATPFSLKGRRIQAALQAAWREHARHWRTADHLLDETKLASPPDAFFESVLKHYTATKGSK